MSVQAPPSRELSTLRVKEEDGLHGELASTTLGVPCSSSRYDDKFVDVAWLTKLSIC